MSGECNKCNEHCLDCQCPKKSLMYDYLLAKDPCLITLIKHIDNLIEMNNELLPEEVHEQVADSIMDIMECLYKEIGVRVTQMFI